MTTISEVKKALENFRVLFIEDESNYLNLEVKVLIQFLATHIRIITVDDIDEICKSGGEKFDFVILNLKDEKAKITIERILQINQSQTIVIITNTQNFIYFEDDFNGKVMEFIVYEDISLQYIADMIGNILQTKQGTIYND